MTRTEKGYGATYSNVTADGQEPVVEVNGAIRSIPTAWLYPVTLLVLHCYPQRINLYFRDI